MTASRVNIMPDFGDRALIRDSRDGAETTTAVELPIAIIRSQRHWDEPNAVMGGASRIAINVTELGTGGTYKLQLIAAPNSTFVGFSVISEIEISSLGPAELSLDPNALPSDARFYTLRAVLSGASPRLNYSAHVTR